MARIRLGRYECERGRLARVCMCCGAPAVIEKSRNFSWTPPWVVILLLLGVFPYLIASMATTQRCRVDVPLCDEHKNHWLWRTLFAVLSLLAIVLFAIALIAVGVAMEQGGAKGVGDSFAGWVCLGGLGMFLVWLVAVIIVQQSAIRPTEITERDITLTHVSARFVDAMESSDRDRARDDWDHRREPPAEVWPIDHDRDRFSSGR